MDLRQQEKFTTRIRNVVREYPWGLDVIKEFLANADDAGATSFAVVLDKRQHGQVFGSNEPPVTVCQSDTVRVDFSRERHTTVSWDSNKAAFVSKLFNCLGACIAQVVDGIIHLQHHIVKTHQALLARERDSVPIF